MSIVMVAALASAIAVYVVMLLAVAQARQAVFYRERTRAQYAAEAGVEWAMQRLFRTPDYCGDPDPPSTMFDPPITVDVTVTNCGGGNPHTIKAKVTY